jgi:cell wall-associated NlpC family hydrolase
VAEIPLPAIELSGAESVNDLIGKPYRLGAIGPDAYDCWSLAAEVAKRRGVNPPGFEVGGLNLDAIRAMIDGSRHNLGVEVDTPQDGDVLLSLRLGHIGTLLNGMVLHTHRKAGVVFERVESFRLKYKDAAAYRWSL